MRPRALELLACPRCLGTLVETSVSAREDDDVLEGELACAGCKTAYPIRGGVPRLLPEAERVRLDAQRTVDRFAAQWSDFDFINPYYEKQFLGWIRPNQPREFEGKVVLEGGCGKGRHSALVAGWGAKDVIAVDLGTAIETARKNARHAKNVHFVQADMLHLPVRPGSLDVAFSVGVLHHTQSPRAAFVELASRVRPGGKVIAWVYGRENNEWILNFVDPVRRRLTSRLPHRAVYHLSKLPAAVLYALIRGVYEPMNHGPLEPIGRHLFYQAYLRAIGQFPFHEIHSIVHDHLTPPIAEYIPRGEFEEWFRAAGLENVEITWHNENSWSGTGRVSARAHDRAGAAQVESP